jgi:hypothetical protein
MSKISSTDKKFLATLQRWFRSRKQKEVLLMIRYAFAAGSKDFEIHTTYKALKARIRKLKPCTWIVVFRQAQLPVRGAVDEDLIQQCLACVADGSDYLISERTPRTYGRSTWYHWSSGRSHEKMLGDLEKLRGQEIAAGPYPAWLKETQDVVSAIVPDEDGAVKLGIY